MVDVVDYEKLHKQLTMLPPNIQQRIAAAVAAAAYALWKKLMILLLLLLSSVSISSVIGISGKSVYSPYVWSFKNIFYIKIKKRWLFFSSPPFSRKIIVTLSLSFSITFFRSPTYSSGWIVSVLKFPSSVMFQKYFDCKY